MTQKKKPNHAAFLLLFFTALYVGYCLGTLYGQDINLDNFILLVEDALKHPLPVRITEYTGKMMLLSVLVWGLAYTYYLGTVRNYMPGREYGSARIAPPKEVNRQLADRDPGKNKIMSEHVRISMDTRLTGLNNNMIVIGGSGAGKSFRLVKPNAYCCSGSYVFTDPKGELLRDTGNYLEAHGYRIKVINLVDMDSSDCYNPFDYIRSAEDIEKLITNLISNTNPKTANASDPFWERAESMLLQSIMYYAWYEYPRQGKKANFSAILELLNLAQINEDDKKKSELDERMEQLEPDHPAYITYHKVMTGAADTKRSILISAHSRLSRLQNPKILRILDHDEIDIPSLGEGVYHNTDRKTALYLVIPDNDKTYSFVIGLLYTQLFQELYYVADNKYGGRLPIHVSLWMDEFANIALPDSFCEIESTMRSREISCNIIIQNLAQIKGLFEKTWETVTGNCDSFIYLGGNEQSTHEYVSKLIGKFTVDKRTNGETLGSHGSSSRNYDVLGREILTPDEVRKLERDKCIIFIRGFDPVVDDKYHTLEKPEFQEAMAMGPYINRKKREETYEAMRLQMYLGGYPHNGRLEDEYAKSFRAQVERYGWVAEESSFYSLTAHVCGEYIKFPMTMGYYTEHGSNLKKAPLFLVSARRVRSGGQILNVHDIAGYWTEYDEEDGPTLFQSEDERAYTFNEYTRGIRGQIPWDDNDPDLPEDLT